jgi:cation:H+ antiporter
MLLSALWIGLGIVLLYGGAEGLVRGSASAAARIGLTPLVIGLTVVAFGTSAPELAVSVDAALAGEGDVAVGNVVGSNIGNIGFILALAAMIRPTIVQAQIIRFDVPVLLGVTLAFLLMLADARIARWEAIVLLAGLVAYTWISLRLARAESPAIQEEYAAGMPPRHAGLARDAVLALGGLILLVIGARLLVAGAIDIAGAFGISDAVIALIVVALGTSLPELATSVLAASRGQADIAVGNIIGSNLFNVLGIIGLAGTIRPLADTGMQLVDLGMLLGMTLVLLPLMRSGFRINRGEGAFLLLLYCGYLGHLLLR